MNIYISGLGMNYLAGGVALVGVVYDNEHAPEILGMGSDKREREKHTLFKRLKDKYTAEYRYLEFGTSEITFFKHMKIQIESILFALTSKLGVNVYEANIFMPTTLPRPSFGNVHRIKAQKKLPPLYMTNFMAKTRRYIELNKLDLIFPEYHFKLNYGSFTDKHINAILKHGLCPQHRQDITERIALGLGRIWSIGETRFVYFRKYLWRPLPDWWQQREKLVFDRTITILKDYYQPNMIQKINHNRYSTPDYHPEIANFIKTNAPENVANELFL